MLELFMNNDWCYPEWSMGCPIDSNVKYEICRIVSYVIPSQNQLVMRKIYLNFLWTLTSHHMDLGLEWL